MTNKRKTQSKASGQDGAVSETSETGPATVTVAMAECFLLSVIICSCHELM